ncbi:MAG: histidine kinase [Crocinitomicaceae bacterium]|nr:histidine kinase [Crocinitomicaceae bacterium]
MYTQKKLYWTAQTIGWLVYTGLTILATFAQSAKEINSGFWASLVFLIFTGATISHLMRLIILKKDWLEMRFLKVFPRLILMAVIAAILLTSLLVIFSKVFNIEDDKSIVIDNPIFKFAINFLGAFILMVLWLVIYFTYHYFRRAHNQELYSLQLQSIQNEVELSNLRSQLNPHFLFNSLNSIRALIDIEPANAKKSITALSNLLRSSLVFGKNEFISLGEELEIVKNYLDLEKIRFEERLNVVWELDTRLNGFMIPPFLLQTQAENAVKHGVSRIVAGGKIIIRTEKLDKQTVRLSIINNGTLGFETDLGIGIQNTKRRLDLLYQGKAKFLLIQDGEFVVSSVEIKTDEI